jgi:rSAM-associated Gly-rich repeat protein
MTQDRRSLRALAALLPTGFVGLSMGLASADAMAAASSAGAPTTGTPQSVALRLEAIRNSVSVVIRIPMDGADTGDEASAGDNVQLAWWGNGWRNGGWHNGGWHNGGWGNGGWHNGGWGNGGWGNGGLLSPLLGGLFGSPWGNGWHNGGWGNGGWHNGGWHNGWHNW